MDPEITIIGLDLHWNSKYLATFCSSASIFLEFSHRGVQGEAKNRHYLGVLKTKIRFKIKRPCTRILEKSKHPAFLSWH